MLPSDPWDHGSPGGQPTSSRDESRAVSPSRISIDHLAVLLSAKDEGTPAELTRDLQLNDIVEQACLATGATGAAIALARGDELICRASTGKTAPDLGIRLNTEHGLSAFCVNTRETQRCDDCDFDPRVDAEACRQLGVRSVLVIPMVYGDFLLGIFEIFSPHSFAFHDRDAETLLALSRSVLIALGISTLPQELEPAPEPVASPEPMAPARFHFSDLVAAGGIHGQKSQRRLMIVGVMRWSIRRLPKYRCRDRRSGTGFPLLLRSPFRNSRRCSHREIIGPGSLHF